MKKSTVTVLLILTLACLLLPAAALAAELWIAGTQLGTDTYYVNDGAGITTINASASNYNAYLDSAGTTLYLKDLNVLGPSSKNGDYNYVIFGYQVGSMTLVLEGDNTIRTKAGGSSDKTAAIYIHGGDLTIDGSGKLTATGTDTNQEASYGIYIREGNLTVKSGTVIATGGNTTDNGYNYAMDGSHGAYANWAVRVTGGTLKGYGGVSSITSRGISTGPNGHGSTDSCDVSASGGGILEGHGGATSKTSYGVYADYQIDVESGSSITGTGSTAAQKSYGVYAKRNTTTVNGTLKGTGGDLTGNTGEANFSYGVYSGGIVTVTGALTGTGGKVELGSGNSYAATSIGVQCGGEVNVNNGSLTGTGGAAVAITNDAVSIGVDVSSGLTVTGNNGSVIGNGGASSKTSGSGEASSYGVRCGGSVVVGSSSVVQTAALSGTGSTANDAPGINKGWSFGVYGAASTGAFTVNEGATLTGNGGAAFNSNGVFTGNKDCAVKGTFNGTGNATSSGASYGVNAGSGSIDLSGSMTARANGGDTGNASTSIGVSAGGGIHMTGQGYLLASTAAVTLNDNHNAKRPRTSDGQNALTAEDAAVWRGAASASYQSIATYRAGYEDSAYRSRLEVRNAGNGLTATPGSWDFAARTQGTTLSLPAAKEFTVENTGGVALSSISADALTDYTVTLSKTSLAAGESMQVTVQPNATALNAPGDHVATLTLRGSPGDALVMIPLSFPVNAAPTVTLDASPTVVASGAEVVLTAQTTGGTMPYQEYEWSIEPTSGGTTTQTTSVNTLKVYPTERTTYGVRVKDACGVYATSGKKRVDIETYTISVDPALLSFGAVREGYTPPPAAQTVTVRNTGTMAVHLNAVSSTNFIATDFGTSTLATGNITTFTLQPKPGLTPGDQSETLTITTTKNSSAALSASFYVTSASALSIDMQPGTAYPVGQCGRDYEVIIGAGTPSADLGAANLGGVTVLGADGTDRSPAFGTDYDKRDGSIVITLREAYLNRLPAGAYTLTASIASGIYAGQTPSLVFRVVDGVPENLPQTGDSARPMLWLAFLCLAGAGLAVFAAIKRREARGR